MTMNVVRILAKAVCGAFALVMLILVEMPASAQTYTVLYSFSGVPDGAEAYSNLIRDSAANLYGTTLYGGAYNSGSIYSLSSDGVENVLYSLDGGSNGYAPSWGLVRDSTGNIYITNDSGGDLTCRSGLGCGTLGKFSPETGQFTVLHTFESVGDGSGPRGLIRDSAGNMFGVTVGGGLMTECSGGGCGTVFKVDAQGNFSVLHAFTNEENIMTPSTLAMDPAGNVYGTSIGGGIHYHGTLFQIDPSGTFKLMYSFSRLTGVPYAGPVRSGNYIYGTTLYGGKFNYGTMYRFSLKTLKSTTLYHFTNGADGGSPEAPLVVDSGGNVYGITATGGDFSCNNILGPGCGTVFKLDHTNQFTVLHTFNGADGKGNSQGMILDRAGNLYGTTYEGGAHGLGVVFKITPQ